MNTAVDLTIAETEKTSRVGDCASSHGRRDGYQYSSTFKIYFHYFLLEFQSELLTKNIK